MKTNEIIMRYAAGERDFRDVDLGGADLRGVDLNGADLQGANLRGADLSRANLQGCDLRGADLSQANLQGSNLRRARLSQPAAWMGGHLPAGEDVDPVLRAAVGRTTFASAQYILAVLDGIALPEGTRHD